MFVFNILLFQIMGGMYVLHAHECMYFVLHFSLVSSHTGVQPCHPGCENGGICYRGQCQCVSFFTGRQCEFFGKRFYRCI